jgi:flavin-dependent dehydrogenase
MRVDVAIVGGGPAGLATAIEARRRGLSVLVLERNPEIPDKACGEGLMPEGVRWLESRGAAQFLDREQCMPFVGIRYLQGSSTCAQARFRDGAGLGIRRMALTAALQRTAIKAGAVVEHGMAAKLNRIEPEAVFLDAGTHTVEARIAVAADGLLSPIRRQAGLDLALPELRRYGQRRHFRGVGSNDFVDVHWSDGVEAYVTPVGPGQCGVAMLWEKRAGENVLFEELLTRFPRLQTQLAGAEPISDVRGAGPLERRAKACLSGRLVLIGDAAGYVDAITGEGITLAFASATALGEVLPAAVSGDASVLSRYAVQHAKLFKSYARLASALVWLSRRPKLRAGALAAISRVPGLFDGGFALLK